MDKVEQMRDKRNKTDKHNLKVPGQWWKRLVQNATGTLVYAEILSKNSQFYALHEFPIGNVVVRLCSWCQLYVLPVTAVNA